MELIIYQAKMIKLLKNKHLKKENVIIAYKIKQKKNRFLIIVK